MKQALKIQPTSDSPIILLVDDSPDDRERYVRALKKIGDVQYRYLEAAGGDSMLACLATARPDCVLLDYSLPGRNGLDLLRQLVPEFPFLPIVMMTGQGNENIAVQAIKSGAQHYLIKSEITPELLHETILAAIKHSALERDRELLVQRLTDTNTELERFAYVASHDLQEPIRTVVSFSKILSEEYGQLLDEAGKEFLSVVLNSSSRMHDMVADLLAYTRADEGNHHFVYFEGTLALDGALENLRGLITERNAEVNTDALPALYGNPVQLTRLLQNLIINAIKYQPSDNIPKVRITIADEPKHWCIAVTDNGLGIEEKYLNRIFEPFRRLHVWEDITGVGLGLSICKKIAEGHGGTIWATSQEGKGSIFYVTLIKPARTASMAQ
jgi:signal transduction histidine kinase